jgi:hypothetical protein
VNETRTEWRKGVANGTRIPHASTLIDENGDDGLIKGLRTLSTILRAFLTMATRLRWINRLRRTITNSPLIKELGRVRPDIQVFWKTSVILTRTRLLKC